MGLITAQEIYTNTSMGGNVDPDKFNHIIRDIQVLVLEPILGTALYDKIVTDFNEGSTNNLAGDYLTMFNDYIKPVLWHSCYADYLRDGVILARNGGIITHNPTDGSPSNSDDIKYVAKRAQSKADTYIERLERFLCDQDIPEYKDSQPNAFDLSPKRDVGTIGGWYLAGTNYNRNSYGYDGNGNYLELE
jgi:hypothetical protein